MVGFACAQNLTADCAVTISAAWALGSGREVGSLEQVNTPGFPRDPTQRTFVTHIPYRRRSQNIV